MSHRMTSHIIYISFLTHMIFKRRKTFGHIMKMVHETKCLGTTAIKYITYLKDVCHSYQRIMLSYSYSYSSGGARLAVCGGGNLTLRKWQALCTTYARTGFICRPSYGTYSNAYKYCSVLL